MSTNDGGPVFPTPFVLSAPKRIEHGAGFSYTETKYPLTPGMSVRDLYAGVAMCLLILEDPHLSCEKIGRASQLLAQAMIDAQPKEDE